MSDPLADATDVAKVLGRELSDAETASAAGCLAKASALFRAAACDQQFTPGTSTVRLKVNGERVRLDQRPVVAVAAVVDDAGDDVTYTRNGSWLNVPGVDSSVFLTVTYSHGGTVPAEVVQAVAEMATRLLIVPEEVRAGGKFVSELMGPFQESTTYGDQNQTILTEDNLMLARSFCWRGGQVVVQRP